ncbi:MAG TPA: VIT1/CCC1 transporter family protein [Candidatus Hydromicrobium sp.]
MRRIKKSFLTYINLIKAYNRIANITRIVRRYFAINGFDGVITSIGVLVGNFIIGITEYKHVIIAGSAIIISLGISGVWSAYNSETAERKRELDDLEESTLHNLDKTIISRAQKFAAVVLAIANGLSPVVTAFIPLIPFLFGKYIPINICYYSGFALAFLILFGIGLFLGKISRSNLLISGIKMLVAGGFCIALSLLLKLIE